MANQHYPANSNGLMGAPAPLPLTEEEMDAEAEALFPNQMTPEEECGLNEDLIAKSILRNGFDEEDIRAEEEYRDRVREDWLDVSDVLDEMGCGRERDYGDEEDEEE